MSTDALVEENKANKKGIAELKIENSEIKARLNSVVSVSERHHEQFGTVNNKLSNLEAK